MILRYLFDEKTREDFITNNKYPRIISFVLGLVCLVLSFFVDDVEWSRICKISSLTLFCLWISTVLLSIHMWRKHARKILIENDGITLYTSGGKLYHKYLFSEYKSAKRIIAIEEPGPVYTRCSREDVYKETIVLYRDMELYEGMEYRSYWNDKNILFIQNPEAIAEVEKYIS